MRTKNRLRCTGFAAVALAAAVFIASVPGLAEVRAEIRRAIQGATAAVTAGDYAGAMDIVRKAEVVTGLTDEERSDIAQMKDYIAVKSGGAFGVFSDVTAQAKFAADYNAERYRNAISDEESLIHYGALTDEDMLVIQQAYYKLGDYMGCARYGFAHTIPIDSATELQLRCIWEVNDEDLVRPAIVRLLGAAEVAALAGCHDKALTRWQAAVLIGRLNSDEQRIVDRMGVYIASKAALPDGGENCRDPKIDNDASWRSAG